MSRKMTTIIATCIITSLLTASSYANTPELLKNKERTASKVTTHKATEKKPVSASSAVTIIFKNFPEGTQLQWSAASFSTGFSNESANFYTFLQPSYTLSLTEQQIQKNCGVPVAQLANPENNCMVQINLPNHCQFEGNGINITGPGSYTADYNSGSFGTC